MQDDSIESAMSDSVKLGVMIHRMGVLETGLTDIGNKLDNMGNLYPTMMHVELLSAPLREKIEKLEKKEEDRVLEQTRNSAQFRLAMIMAILSPIFSFLVILVMDKK